MKVNKRWIPPKLPCCTPWYSPNSSNNPNTISKLTDKFRHWHTFCYITIDIINLLPFLFTGRLLVTTMHRNNTVFWCSTCIYTIRAEILFFGNLNLNIVICCRENFYINLRLIIPFVMPCNLWNKWIMNEWLLCCFHVFLYRYCIFYIVSESVNYIFTIHRMYMQLNSIKNHIRR